MADTCITCDVAIVGSGFAGSLIANELSKKGIKVAILEAGPGIQPISTTPWSFLCRQRRPSIPYPPDLPYDPATVRVGRPTALTLSQSPCRTRASLISIRILMIRIGRRRPSAVCTNVLPGHVAPDGPHAAAGAERFPNEKKFTARASWIFLFQIGRSPTAELKPLVRESGGRARCVRRCRRAAFCRHHVLHPRLRLPDAADFAVAVRPARRQGHRAVDRSRDPISWSGRRP